MSVVTESGSNMDNQPEVIISGFDDLAGYEWAENEIKLLFDKGVISTSPDKRYRPGDDITREHGFYDQTFNYLKDIGIPEI